MDGDDTRQVLASLLLLFGSVFFVAAEYGILSARKSRIEALAKKGNRTAAALAKDLDNLSPYVAANQIAITMIGVGVGSVTEPYITEKLQGLFGTSISPAVGYGLSFVFISFLLVVVGELVPKYWTLSSPESVALRVYPLLRLVRLLLAPLVWLAQNSAALILKPFGIALRGGEGDALAKEELLLLIQSGGAGGTLDKLHAEVVGRALRLDVLDAADVMVHRLDIAWLDAGLSALEVKRKLREIPHTRIPVCRGDIDELIGIAYLHDIVKAIDRPDFRLEKIMKPAIFIPENLSLERVVATMREQHSQMLVVTDEYGGTSGILTLEDVVEEIFGELEDQLESERPPIVREAPGRISARAEVRLDELVAFLGLELDIEDRTDTLAQLVVDNLGKAPKVGDEVDSLLGRLRVENMARQRITRVKIELLPELAKVEAEAEA